MLKYHDETPAMAGFKRISKPSRRMYIKAEEIRRSAENTAEKELIELFSEIHDKKLIVDLVKGWQVLENYLITKNKQDPEFVNLRWIKKNYKNFSNFLREIAFGTVNIKNKKIYLNLVKEYEDNLPVLEYYLHDRKAILAILAGVTSLFANIVDVNIRFNTPDYPPGIAEVSMKVEADNPESLEVLTATLEDLTAQLKLGSEAANEDYSFEIDLPIGIDVSPLVSLFSGFDLTLHSMIRGENNKVTFNLVPINRDENILPFKIPEILEKLKSFRNKSLNFITVDEIV